MRGSACRSCTWGVWYPFRGVGPIPFEIQRTIEPALRARYRRSMWVYLASAYPYIGLGSQVVGWVLLPTPSSLTLVHFGVVFAYMVLGVAAIILFCQYLFGARLMPSKARHIVARTIVTGGYCASCGYPIVNAVLAAREDGKVDCPECGATWS